MRNVQWRPLDEAVSKVREEARQRARQVAEAYLKDAEETVQRMEQNRQAAALLDAAGFDLDLPEWSNGSRFHVDLGFFPQTKAGRKALAKAWRTVRLALGCRLDKNGELSVDDAKKQTVVQYLVPTDFPGVRVKYTTKLRRGGKCRFVVRTERSKDVRLVCER